MLSREAKVGLFTLIAFAVLFWATFYIGKFDTSFGDTKTYQVVLTSAHQLGIDSPVEIAGVKVGRISKISIVKNGTRAVVEIRLKGDVEIYKDARVAIYTVGFLGDRYVDLVPGTPATGLLPEDQPIVDTQVPIALEEMLAQMTPLIQDAVGLLKDMRTLINREEIQDGIPATIDSLRHTALSLELILSDYEKYVSKAIRNVANGAETISERLPGILDKLEAEFGKSGGLFEDVANTVTGTVGQFKEMADIFAESARDLQSILDQINSGQGTIGALVKDQQTADEVKEVVTQLNQTLNKVNQLRTVVNYLGSYESDFGSNDGWRHRTEIQLRPSYDHYYSVGIVNRSEDKITTTQRQVQTTDDQSGTTTSYTQIIRDSKNELLLNGQIAKRFHDLTLRGGILENKGGAGIDYAFFQDQLWLRAEAFDFARNGDRPRVRTWAEGRLFKHITIAAGAEDIAGNAGPRAMFGAGIVFSDEDLKYLFGALPKVDF